MNQYHHVKCGNEFCSKCANSTTECSECFPGLYLDENQICKSCDPSCLTCTGPSESQCSSCADGYSLVNYSSQTYCEMCSSNCKKCSSNFVCQICNEGFYVTDYGVCFECHETCKECTSSYENNCTQCYDGFLFQNPVV